jgi:Domain of unknown function (DUF4417)
VLNQQRDDLRSNELTAHYLTDDPAANTMLLGCPSCSHFSDCGGLSIRETLIDCLGFCCGNPGSCTIVCRNNPERFVMHSREIVGFGLSNVPRCPRIQVNIDADVVELIYHGSRRASPLAAGTVALRLADLINFRKRKLRFGSRAELCKAFQIDPASSIILSGVDHDHRIEPWWALSSDRLPIIYELAAQGIKLISTPNFSILLDSPRTDNLHAIKRIATTFAEFQQGGIACALHVNGRTRKDFERWGNFIAERSEIEILAYEFITGPGRKARMQFHLDSLAYLAKVAGRDLDIVVRGDPNVIQYLRQHFRNVIYVDTTAFVKAQKRYAAERVSNCSLKWRSAPTSPGAPVDALLHNNIYEQIAYLRATHYGSDVYQAAA